MKTNRYVVFALITLFFLFLSSRVVAEGRSVRHLVIADAINPVTARFISEQITLANQQNDHAVLLSLDTPGGLVTAMKKIVQAQLESQVPIIVYVAPAGAGAASAGALITMAADFAVMAPGTNIGAASPVSVGPGQQGEMDSTMKSKVFNDFIAYSRSIAEKRGRNVQWAEDIVKDARSSSAEEALELKVVDLIAESVDEALQALVGKTYLRQGKAQTFEQAGPLMRVDMGWRLELLSALSNPTVAYMLLMLGILGVFFEISQPGVILPGVVGGIALLLAFFAFQMLPVNLVGVLLLLLGVVLFILEVTVSSYGMLSVGGIISLTMGSLILIDSDEPFLQISTAAIVATVLVFSSFMLLSLFYIVRTQKTSAFSGHEGMIDKQGVAETDIDGSGRVFVYGEYWQAVSDRPIAKGEAVKVVAMNGLILEVEAVHPSHTLDS